MSSASIRSLTPQKLENETALVDLLVEAVNAGASLGFLAPLSHAEAAAYWGRVCTEVQSGSRIVVAAFTGNTLVGSGQLFLPAWPNAHHRAEVHKLMVARSARGQGVGSEIMRALHAEALKERRTLLLLNTRHGENNEKFYRGLGYREASVIPGYTCGATGERYANLTMFQELDG